MGEPKPDAKSGKEAFNKVFGNKGKKEQGGSSGSTDPKEAFNDAFGIEDEDKQNS